MAETAVRTIDSLPPHWEVVRLGKRLREHLPELRAHHHIDTVVLFGSYVRNEQRPDSDLDVLATFTRSPSLFELMHAEDDLTESLGVRVDLVLRSGLQPRIAQYVLREAVRL